jgi:type III pantothenate kinase
MLLAIDVGNTNTVVGVFSGEKLLDYFRIASNEKLTHDECGILVRQLLGNIEIPPEKIEGVCLCSVVPALTQAYEEMSRKYFSVEPLAVSASSDLGMEIVYDNPEQVGADRLADAVAAYELYGGPAIVVDFGTATTFDYISAEGEYVGGAIAPGVETSSSTLFYRAAQLFKVRLEPPRSVVGKNTTESLKAGIIYGTVGQVEGIISRMKDEIGQDKVKVLATGGLAPVVAKLTSSIEEVNLTLTLEGLRIIHARANRHK